MITIKNNLDLYNWITFNTDYLKSMGFVFNYLPRDGFHEYVRIEKDSYFIDVIASKSMIVTISLYDIEEYMLDGKAVLRTEKYYEICRQIEESIIIPLLQKSIRYVDKEGIEQERIYIKMKEKFKKDDK